MKKKSGLSKLCGRIFHNMCYNRVSELLARDLIGHAYMCPMNNALKG